MPSLKTVANNNLPSHFNSETLYPDCGGAEAATHQPTIYLPRMLSGTSATATYTI